MKKSTKLKIARSILTASLMFDTAAFVSLTNPIKVEAATTNVKSYDNYVDYYSNVFNLNSDIVKEYIQDKTRNYTAYEFNNYNVIDGKQYDSNEQAILETIRNIYYNPSNYLEDDEVEQIKSEDEYIPDKSPEEMCEKYSELYNIDKVLAMSICYSECGCEMDSENYLYNNNPAGLGPYIHFENTEIAYIYYIKLLRESYKIDENSDINDLSRIAPIYCTSNPDHWTGMATSFYYELAEDYFKYDETNKKANKKLIQKG